MAASAKSGRVPALLLVLSAGVAAAALLSARLFLEPPTVPAYTITAGGPALHAADTFRADVMPSAPVDGAIAARAFLLRGDTVRAWDPPFSVEPGGAVHLTGRVDTLFAGIPGGAWEVAIAVGRPETLPTAPKDVLRARDATADTRSLAWRLVRAPVDLE